MAIYEVKVFVKKPACSSPGMYNLRFEADTVQQAIKKAEEFIIREEKLCGVDGVEITRVDKLYTLDG